MKRSYLFGLLLAAAMLAGCRPDAERSAAGEESVVLGTQYSAKNGLLIPEDTRRSIGLKTAEVTERKVPAALALLLRVYQNGNGNILASSTLAPEQAKALKAGLTVEA